MGETCGACFNPDINNDCGKCAPNLACQSADPRLPDLPGKCVKEEDLKGNSIIPFKQNDKQNIIKILMKII